jgi:hypothetical protein
MELVHKTCVCTIGSYYNINNCSSIRYPLIQYARISVGLAKTEINVLRALIIEIDRRIVNAAVACMRMIWGVAQVLY